MSKLLEIKLYGNEILKKIAEPVNELTPEIKELIENMIHTMYLTEGIGLAAPQVGVSLRIVVIDYQYSKSGEKNPLVLVNPEFIEFSGETVSEEGCLSLPNVFADVTRFECVKLKYYDINMEERLITAEDVFSIVLQHEIDHLNGVLFVDKLSSIKRMSLAFKLNRIKNIS